MTIALPHGKSLTFSNRPLMMGIVNVTPDSFSDGGKFFDADAALRHATKLADEGADILDIGGESTRPGHTEVSADEEAARVVPVVRQLAMLVVTPISIDTMKASVARAAMASGASIINDVWGFQHDPQIAHVAAETGALCILMHNRRTEDDSIDIIDDVRRFLKVSIDIAVKAGVDPQKIVLDPGVGFGKTHEQSLTCIARLADIRALGFPVLIGASRKRIIGRITGRADPAQRAAGSIGAALAAAARGASILRVHDVAEHLDALRVYGDIDAIERHTP